MAKYREILRQRAMGASVRNVAFSCRCSTATVRTVADRAKACGLEWPLPEDMNDAAIYPKKPRADASKAGIDQGALLHAEAELSNCEWARNRRNVLITGASGAGKSWMACALGVAACSVFFSVRYVRLPEMLDELVVDKDDEWPKMKKRYLKCDLLILDDWLLEKVDGKRARELLEIVKGRKRPSPNQAAHHCHVAACPGTVQQHSVESRSKNGAIVTRRGCRVPAPRSPPR